MPDLYRLHVGPINAAYYQRQFQHFESAGKVTPSWNHSAAFFTLPWLLLRKLWRPAAIYGALLLAVLALWWWGIHGRVPLAVEGAVCAVAALLLCVLPGLIGNGLYYQHVRQLTLKTLTSAASLSQARVQLAEQAITKERVQLFSGIQALVALAIVYAAFSQSGEQTAQLALSDTATRPVSGPPDLVIPATANILPLELAPFTPDVALAAPEPESTAPAASVPTEATPVQATSSATTPVATPAAEELSIVAFAQSVPAQAAASAVAAAAPVAARASATKQAPTATASASVKPAISAKPVPPAATPAKPPVVAKAATKSASGQPAGQYYLNAGVYAQASNVDAAVKKLKAAKLNTVRQTVSGKNGQLTRLRIGPFDTRQQAQQAASQARKLRIETSIVEPPKR